jgi:hypothetical protein
MLLRLFHVKGLSGFDWANHKTLCNETLHVRFEVLSWDVAPCSLVDTDRSYSGAWQSSTVGNHAGKRSLVRLWCSSRDNIVTVLDCLTWMGLYYLQIFTTTVKFGSQLPEHAKTTLAYSGPLAPSQFTCYSAFQDSTPQLANNDCS